MDAEHAALLRLQTLENVELTEELKNALEATANASRLTDIIEE